MIELESVSVTYAGGVSALSNVSVAIASGEFVFLVGPTGAGKSTFLKLLYREHLPTQGQVRVAGQDVASLRRGQVPLFRRNIGIVFQDFGLLPNRTAWENVAFALRVTGASRQTIHQSVSEVLEQVGMDRRPDAFPHQLSGGEQQRVAIARALVHHPALLLADEPTGNLDPDTSAGIADLLAAINARGTTVLAATHDPGIVDRLNRRLLAFYGGRIVRDEPQGQYHPEPQADGAAQPIELSFSLDVEAVSSEEGHSPTLKSQENEAAKGERMSKETTAWV